MTRKKIRQVNDNHIVGDESRSGKQAILAPRKADDVRCFVALSAIYVGRGYCWSRSAKTKP